LVEAEKFVIPKCVGSIPIIDWDGMASIVSSLTYTCYGPKHSTCNGTFKEYLLLSLFKQDNNQTMIILQQTTLENDFREISFDLDWREDNERDF
jgi:hypothetical protein